MRISDWSSDVCSSDLFGDPARWVAEHFRFKRNEEWETLATVDYAMEHLQSLGIEADAGQVLQYIRADDEWRAKIEKLRLTEMSEGSALLEEIGRESCRERGCQ